MSITYITIPVTMLIMIFHALSFIVEETEQYKRIKGGKAV
jgi:TRAP-type C4-dicarboxylate transport system permease small subunit